MTGIGNNEAKRLQSYVLRVERLETEKAERTVDISEVYKEASSAGYDAKTIRRLVRERKKDPAKLANEEALLDVYRRALEGIADLPLGIAALKAVGG